MNKKGFSATELLISFIIIGVILLVIFPSFFVIINNAKNDSYRHTVLLIEDITKLYVINLSKKDKTIEEITIGELIEQGILDADLKDPRTNKSFSKDDKLLITKKDGDYIIKYMETK